MNQTKTQPEKDLSTAALFPVSDQHFTDYQEARMNLAVEALLNLENDLIDPLVEEIEDMDLGTKDQWVQLRFIASALLRSRVMLEELAEGNKTAREAHLTSNPAPAITLHKSL